MNAEKRATRPRLTSVTLFVAAALAFLLPFGTVSCDSDEVSFTGLELATYQVDADSSSADLRADVESEAGWLALIALAASLTGVFFAAVGRRGGGICASVGLLAMQLLFLSAAASLATVEVRAGFWLTLIALGAVSIHLLAIRLGERRRLRTKLWPSILGAVLMALPTLLFVLLVGASLSEASV